MSEGRMTAEQTPDIETVLAEHVLVGGTWWDYKRKETFHKCQCGAHCYWAKPDENFSAHVAAALAPVLAAAVREARAAELREAADEAFAMDYPSSQDPAHWGIWLRHRADRIAVDAPEGGA